MITLENGAAFIASAIAASTVFTDAGLAIYSHESPELGCGIYVEDFAKSSDGQSDAIRKGDEQALTSLGLSIAVYQFTAATPNESVESTAFLNGNWEVFVRENVIVNRGADGTGIKCSAAAAEVVRSVLNSNAATSIFRKFAAGAIRNLGLVDGTWTCSVQFRIPVVIQ